jgi:hypothetical protein
VPEKRNWAASFAFTAGLVVGVGGKSAWDLTRAAEPPLIQAAHHDRSPDASPPDAGIDAAVSSAAVRPIDELLPAGEPGPAWTYHESTDEMRGTHSRTACLVATGLLRLDFPYQDARGTLCVRQREGEALEVFVGASEGQAQCSYSGCSVPVRFDDGDVTAFRAERSDRGNTVFVRDADGFVRELLESSTLIVEIDFYRNANTQIRFDNVAGLEWTLPRPQARRRRVRCADVPLDGPRVPCDY